MSLDLTSIDPQFIFNMDKGCEDTVYIFDNFRLDAAHLMLYRGSEEVSLPPKAIETLLALVEKRNQIVAKNELIETIWKETVVEEQNLAQYLHLLRKALGNRPDGKPFIETLRRRGYRFNGEVGRVESRLSESPQPSFLPGSERIEPAPAFANAATPGLFKVKRSGNVLALADWRRDARHSHEIAEQPAAELALGGPVQPRAVSYRQAAVAFTLLFLLSVAIVFALRFAPLFGSPATYKGDISYLRLTDGSDVEDAAVSPDGKYFVYHEQDGSTAHLWLQQTGQSDRIEVLPPAERKIFGTTFSPGGEFIYFVAQERQDEPNDLFRVTTLGGVQTRILTDVAAPVSFSPDAKQIAFLRWDPEDRESTLLVADSDGANERILSKRAGAEEFSGGVAWSPDGRRIAVGLTTLPPESDAPYCSLISIDPQTGDAAGLSDEKWDTCYRMGWMHDGRGLVFIGTKLGEGYSTRRDQVYFVSAADGSARRITTEGSRHQPDSISVTDDDRLLVVPYNRASQIWAADTNGHSRAATQLTTGTADGRAGIAPLADGRIGYIARAGENFGIWVMNPDGSDRRQLTGNPGIVEELRATPDGRYFVFSARRGGRSHLFRIEADGTALKQLTDGDSNEIDSAISPDGKWVVCTSYNSDGDLKNILLEKVPIDGGEPIQLARIDAAAPQFSPDGNFVSFATSDEKIGIIPARGGSPVKMFEPVQNPLLNVGARWSPDGRSLIYIARRKDVGNLWSQPLDGGPPRPVTNFTSGDIYNFAFSADGSRFYLARGYQIRDAILIRNFR